MLVIYIDVTTLKADFKELNGNIRKGSGKSSRRFFLSIEEQICTP
jgi:hypothetical protein